MSVREDAQRPRAAALRFQQPEGNAHIRLCLDHPNAANKTFLVADAVDLSVPELICEIANSMGKKCSLLPVPVPALKLGAMFFGYSIEFARLTGSLQADTHLVTKCLDWKPPVSTREGILKTVQWFRGVSRQ